MKNNPESITELENALGTAVTICGVARDAKAGAVVVTVGGVLVYIQDRPRWPQAWLENRVRVGGVLRKKQIYPLIKGDQENPGQGMYGIPFVLELDQYALEDGPHAGE